MGGLGPKMTWGDADDRASKASVLRAVELGINWSIPPPFTDGSFRRGPRAAIAQLPEADRPISPPSAVCAGPGRAYGTGRDPGLDPLGAGRVLMRLGSSRSMFITSTGHRRRHAHRGVLGELVDLRRRARYGPPACPTTPWPSGGGRGRRPHRQPAAAFFGHRPGRRPGPDPVVPRARSGGGQLCPMQNGLLTGTFSEQRVQQLADNDWRKTHANFTGENLAAMSPWPRPCDRSRQTRHHRRLRGRRLDIGVPGSRPPSSVPASPPGRLHGGAAGLELDYEDMMAIASAIDTTGAGRGPVFVPEAGGAGKGRPAPTRPPRWRHISGETVTAFVIEPLCVGMNAGPLDAQRVDGQPGDPGRGAAATSAPCSCSW